MRESEFDGSLSEAVDDDRHSHGSYLPPTMPGGIAGCPQSLANAFKAKQKKLAPAARKKIEAAPDPEPQPQASPKNAASAPAEPAPERPAIDFIKNSYARVCRDLLGVGVVRTEFPGGESRDSCRLHLEDGRSVIASRRDRQARSLLEEGVLRHLNAQGAPVPKLLGFNGLVLIQEDLGDQRLSVALHRADASRAEQLLDQALESLAQIHRAADAAGLDEAVAPLGTDIEWVKELIDRPAVIGNFLKIPAPVPELKALLDLLTLMRPRFVKWDARPANAMVCFRAVVGAGGPAGKGSGNKGEHAEKVVWFDWEHCGARNRLDDVAWLMGDEFAPALPVEAEERLLAKHLPCFADGAPLDEARLYLGAFGMLHMCVRLGMIIAERGRGQWWDPEYCLETDRIGVALEYAERQCARAARWASWSPLTEALVPWFDEVAAHLRES